VAIFYGAQQRGAYHLYDRRSRTLKYLCEVQPEAKPYNFAPMHGVVLRSRDRRDLVSYLALPREVEGYRPPEPLPMVLSVHGGPWVRDRQGFNSFHQWLADRGYAVLSVNYRGSSNDRRSLVTSPCRLAGSVR
jgi:acylaminoacyl-peptidase